MNVDSMEDAPSLSIVDFLNQVGANGSDKNQLFQALILCRFVLNPSINSPPKPKKNLFNPDISFLGLELSDYFNI